MNSKNWRNIHARFIVRVIVPNVGIRSSQRGNKKKPGYFLIETKPLSHSKQAMGNALNDTQFNFEVRRTNQGKVYRMVEQ